MLSLLIERSIAHPSQLADIALSKFADHQPLYRQSEIAGRDGVTLDRASMDRWVGHIVELCLVLVEATQRYVLAGGKLHGDDTTVPVLTPGNRKATSGRVWVYVRDDRRSGSTEPAAVWFTYSSDRKGVHPQSTTEASIKKDSTLYVRTERVERSTPGQPPPHGNGMDASPRE